MHHHHQQHQALVHHHHQHRVLEHHNQLHRVLILEHLYPHRAQDIHHQHQVQEHHHQHENSIDEESKVFIIFLSDYLFLNMRVSGIFIT